MSPLRLLEYAVVLLAVAVGFGFVFAVIAANYIKGNDQWGDVAVTCFLLEWGLLWLLSSLEE